MGGAVSPPMGPEQSPDEGCDKVWRSVREACLYCIFGSYFWIFFVNYMFMIN